jgi:hypothetical protein
MGNIMIFIYDSLGQYKAPQLADFCFRKKALTGFWVDIRTSSQPIIIFYVGAQSFRTPYTEESHNYLATILNKNR